MVQSIYILLNPSKLCNIDCNAIQSVCIVSMLYHNILVLYNIVYLHSIKPIKIYITLIVMIYSMYIQSIETLVIYIDFILYSFKVNIHFYTIYILSIYSIQLSIYFNTIQIIYYKTEVNINLYTKRLSLYSIEDSLYSINIDINLYTISKIYIYIQCMVQQTIQYYIVDYIVYSIKVHTNQEIDENILRVYRQANL